MSTVKLNTENGSVTLVPEDGTGNVNVAIPRGGVGKVLQVKQGSLNTTLTYSGGWYSIPGLSVTITPTATTSKFLISVNLGCVTSWNQRERSTAFRITRDDAQLSLTGTPESSREGVTFRVGGYNTDGNHHYAETFEILDEVPAGTTNPITYRLQVLPENGAVLYLNRTMTNTDINQSYGSRTVSTFIVTELAG